MNVLGVRNARTRRSLDGLINVASGLGTNISKRYHNEFVQTRGAGLDFRSLEAAYQESWIAKQICDLPAKDATSNWRSIKCDKAEVVKAHEDNLGVAEHFCEGLSFARLFGGAGIIMLTDQDLTKPLRPEKIGVDGLKSLLTLDRHDLLPVSINTWDVLSPNYLLPEMYSVRGGSTQVHWSHVIRLTGDRLPRRLMAIHHGWGASVLQKCLEDIMDISAAKAGISEMMQEVNIDVIKRESLADELASDQDESIIKRYSAFSQMKSIIKLALLDGDETLERKTLNFSGIAPIIEQLITWVSGAAGIPVTKLFGTAAKGMNATGEGDMKNYYDFILSLQKSLFRQLKMLDAVLVRSALGYMPENYDYIWEPLVKLDAKQIEQAAYARALRDKEYLNAGVVTISQVQRNLQQLEVYQFIDEEIAKQEATEDPVEYAAEGGLSGQREIQRMELALEAGINNVKAGDNPEIKEASEKE